ncbi:myb domain-containing protein [Reticulomyxa filosa]|uniref:Myb domain-containing protein n=1 Tax=Reticulomyxa filosa TaxID=46433 RepID=X6NU53_RETFI|nr:myb domain-containing protein [Reticulomyxa filosa]|eukprot:ETO29536.1 myb domain-containing protein [Reticulomyxa filosa]
MDDSYETRYWNFHDIEYCSWLTPTSNRLFSMHWMTMLSHKKRKKQQQMGSWNMDSIAHHILQNPECGHPTHTHTHEPLHRECTAVATKSGDNNDNDDNSAVVVASQHVKHYKQSLMKLNQVLLEKQKSSQWLVVTMDEPASSSKRRHSDQSHSGCDTMDSSDNSDTDTVLIKECSPSNSVSDLQSHYQHGYQYQYSYHHHQQQQQQQQQQQSSSQSQSQLQLQSQQDGTSLRQSQSDHTNCSVSQPSDNGLNIRIHAMAIHSKRHQTPVEHDRVDNAKSSMASFCKLITPTPSIDSDQIGHCDLSKGKNINVNVNVNVNVKANTNVNINDRIATISTDDDNDNDDEDEDEKEVRRETHHIVPSCITPQTNKQQSTSSPSMAGKQLLKNSPLSISSRYCHMDCPLLPPPPPPPPLLPPPPPPSFPSLMSVTAQSDSNLLSQRRRPAILANVHENKERFPLLRQQSHGIMSSKHCNSFELDSKRVHTKESRSCSIQVGHDSEQHPPTLVASRKIPLVRLNHPANISSLSQSRLIAATDATHMTRRKWTSEDLRRIRNERRRKQQLPHYTSPQKFHNNNNYNYNNDSNGNNKIIKSTKQEFLCRPVLTPTQRTHGTRFYGSKHNNLTPFGEGNNNNNDPTPLCSSDSEEVIDL